MEKATLRGTLEAMKIKEFIEGGKMKETMDAIKASEKVVEDFSMVSAKLCVLAQGLIDEAAFLEELVDDNNLSVIEKTLEVINAKLELFEEVKLFLAIDELKTILKLNKQVKKTNKKELAKSLGL